MTPPTAELQAMLDSGVRSGVFPSAQACVLHRGRLAFAGTSGEATLHTVFDLASLTKVLCTASVFLSLWRETRLSPETPLSALLAGGPACDAGVTLADLLYHRSGLPAFVPYFAEVMREIPGLPDAGCPPSVRAQARSRVVEAARMTALVNPRGARAVYSDVGFILLGEALSAAGGAPLDELYLRRVAAPMQLEVAFRRLSAPARTTTAIAPTGQTRPRPPAPGQEGLWAEIPTHPSRTGDVDDDNAWVMDGVAGHAGLFGTAADVARFGHVALSWDTRMLETDRSTPGSTRAMGFDTPSSEGSSAGHLLGKVGVGAVGHTGFTGVSLWIDRARELSVALCTNRTWLGRQALGIKDFRPRFHDAVIEALGLA